jgi:hypothetical protein
MVLSTPGSVLVMCLYYVLVGILSFFSVFGVYVLIRYGKSIPFTLSIAIVYSFFFIKILAETYQTLHGLLS